MSKNMQTLLATAAELRSCGASWEAVGRQVHRSAKTCQHWPRRFAVTWEPLYRDAQRQRYEEAGNEAMTMLRKMLRDNDGKLKLRAGEILMRHGSKLFAHKETVAVPQTEAEREWADWADYRAMAKEARERIDRLRADEGLPPATEEEFHEQWTRELDEVSHPTYITVKFDANGALIQSEEDLASHPLPESGGEKEGDEKASGAPLMVLGMLLLTGMLAAFSNFSNLTAAMKAGEHSSMNAVGDAQSHAAKPGDIVNGYPYEDHRDLMANVPFHVVNGNENTNSPFLCNWEREEMTAAGTVNVASHLAALAQTDPQRLAVVHPSARRQLTFRQLHDESDALAHSLESIGVGRGVRAALMVPPSLEFFTLTFALFKIGAVPVLIDPGMGIRNLGRCLAEAEPTGFIGIPKAHLARRLLGWARNSIKITVTTGRSLSGYSVRRLQSKNQTKGAFPQAPTTADESAAILFTSGSTGIAKGVVYTHGIFAAQVEMLRKMYAIEAGEVDLSTFPLFALFGPALGMTAIIPDMNPTRPANVDPLKIIAAVKQFGVTNLFGSPALINRVGSFGKENGVSLPTLKRVISAGAPVPAKVIERFATMLEGGSQVHTPYGATESLPVSSIGSDVLLKETRFATERGCGICVGRPVEPMQVRIIPISDEPIATWHETRSLASGTIGEIAVAGPVVTTSYFNRPQATELAKIRDPQSGTIWHRMGDLGYLDASGRLWFCGRKSQRVVTKRGTLFTIPCEAMFNVHPFVYRSALVGVPANGDLQPVICVETLPDAKLRWPDRYGDMLAIANRHDHTRSISQVLFHPGFPVDIRHNAKIFREKLAVWAAHQLNRHDWAEDDSPILLPPTFDEWHAQPRGDQP